jgi:membrane protein implicated in regulation of membrane protease activity
VIPYYEWKEAPMHSWTWFAVGGVCAVLEILNFSLFFASFAVGAFIAGFSHLLGGTPAIQWIVFAVATVLSLRLKPIVSRYIFRKTPPLDTGINALMGLKAVATSNITDSSGTIMLKNETWTARSEHGEIANGAAVTVERIEGAIAIVAPRIDSQID